MVTATDNIPYEKVGDKVTPLEFPFEIPESWEWARLGSVVYNRGQISPNTDFCYIDIGSIDNKNQKLDPTDTIITPEKAPSRARKLVNKGDILYSTVRPYLHNMCIVDRECSHIPIASTGFAVLTCHADLLNKFLFYYMMSPDFDAYANNTDNAKGVAYPAINDTRLYKALIPIPPLEEQFRIVSVIESVDMLIRDYGVKEEILRTLNASFPEALKKSILQQAVQGKLVPQDPADESVEVLLERIRAEKQRLVREGKIKKDKHESIIFRRDNSHYESVDGVERCIDGELPFEIPESWSWVRFGTVINLLSGTDFAPNQYNSDNKGIPYITGASNLDEHRVLVNRWTETPKVIANKGDILLVCKGSSYGKTVVCDIEQAHIARQIMAIKKSESLDMLFVKFFLTSNFDVLKAQGQGVIPGIDRGSVLNLLFPLPPHLEQHRIAEKVQESFSICDQL